MYQPSRQARPASAPSPPRRGRGGRPRRRRLFVNCSGKWSRRSSLESALCRASMPSRAAFAQARRAPSHLLNFSADAVKEKDRGCRTRPRVCLCAGLFGAVGARRVATCRLRRKAKGKRQKAKGKSEDGGPRGSRPPLLIFAFCLLPFAFSHLPARARARRGAGASADVSLAATGAGKGTGAGRVFVRRVRRASVRSASTAAVRLAFSMRLRGTSW